MSPITSPYPQYVPNALPTLSETYQYPANSRPGGYSLSPTHLDADSTEHQRLPYVDVSQAPETDSPSPQYLVGPPPSRPAPRESTSLRNRSPPSATGLRPLAQSASVRTALTDPNQPSPVSNPGKPIKPRSKITTVACAPCRKRKSKCNGGRPQCAACIQRRSDCFYDATENERSAKELRDMFKALRDLLPALVSASNQQTAITIASEIQANGFERYRPDQLSYMLHHGVDTIPTMSPSKSEGSPGDASTVAERSGESGLTSNTTPVSGIHAASSLPQNPSYYGSSVIPTESPQLKTRPPTESPYLSPTVSRPDSATARHGHNFIPSPLSIPATVSTIPSPVQGITEALHPVNMMNPGAFVTTGPVLDTKTELTTYPLEYQQVGVLDPQPVAETRQHVRPPRGATTPNPPATERKRYDPYARPNARTNPSRSSRLRGPTSVLPSSSANSAGPASATLVSELSRIVDRYQHAKQADIAAGHDPNIVLGPSGVDIGPIMQPTAIPTSNDDPIATFSAKLASMALPAHLHADRCGIAWIMSHVLRATIAPAYTSVYLPDWLQPTYSQATSFPDSLVNFIPWPSVREALCAGSAMPALTVLAASQVNWPFDGASTITYDYASGGWMLAPAFETHVQELGNWSLARSAATAVLGMGGGNVLQHEG